MTRDVAATAERHLWTERTVAWYERADAWSDYAAQVLVAIGPLLARCRTALDVGAGFGALAIPLAARLRQVTAVEPAPAMVQALRARIERRGLTNVAVIAAAWGAAPVEPHDLVLCAHVSDLMRRDAPFLAEVSRLARRGVVLVRDVPGAADKFFYSELYPRLLGRPYHQRRHCDSAETEDALRALGIAPGVTFIEYSSDQPFDSLEDACDFWIAYMGLDGQTARPFLRTFLAERLERRGDLWIAPFRKRAAIIQWSTDGCEPDGRQP